MTPTANDKSTALILVEDSEEPIVVRDSNGICYGFGWSNLGYGYKATTFQKLRAFLTSQFCNITGPQNWTLLIFAICVLITVWIVLYMLLTERNFETINELIKYVKSDTVYLYNNIKRFCKREDVIEVDTYDDSEDELSTVEEEQLQLHAQQSNDSVTMPQARNRVPRSNVVIVNSLSSSEDEDLEYNEMYFSGEIAQEGGGDGPTFRDYGHNRMTGGTSSWESEEEELYYPYNIVDEDPVQLPVLINNTSPRMPTISERSLGENTTMQLRDDTTVVDTELIISQVEKDESIHTINTVDIPKNVIVEKLPTPTINVMPIEREDSPNKTVRSTLEKSRTQSSVTKDKIGKSISTRAAKNEKSQVANKGTRQNIRSNNVSITEKSTMKPADLSKYVKVKITHACEKPKSQIGEPLESPNKCRPSRKRERSQMIKLPTQSSEISRKRVQFNKIKREELPISKSPRKETGDGKKEQKKPRFYRAPSPYVRDKPKKTNQIEKNTSPNHQSCSPSMRKKLESKNVSFTSGSVSKSAHLSPLSRNRIGDKTKTTSLNDKINDKIKPTPKVFTVTRHLTPPQKVDEKAKPATMRKRSIANRSPTPATERRSEAGGNKAAKDNRLARSPSTLKKTTPSRIPRSDSFSKTVKNKMKKTLNETVGDTLHTTSQILSPEKIPLQIPSPINITSKITSRSPSPMKKTCSTVFIPSQIPIPISHSGLASPWQSEIDSIKGIATDRSTELVENPRRILPDTSIVTTSETENIPTSSAMTDEYISFKESAAKLHNDIYQFDEIITAAERKSIKTLVDEQKQRVQSAKEAALKAAQLQLEEEKNLSLPSPSTELPDKSEPAITLKTTAPSTEEPLKRQKLRKERGVLKRCTTVLEKTPKPRLSQSASTRTSRAGSTKKPISILSSRSCNSLNIKPNEPDNTTVCKKKTVRIVEPHDIPDADNCEKKH